MNKMHSSVWWILLLRNEYIILVNLSRHLWTLTFTIYQHYHPAYIFCCVWRAVPHWGWKEWPLFFRIQFIGWRGTTSNFDIFVPIGPDANKSRLVEIMAWRRSDLNQCWSRSPIDSCFKGFVAYSTKEINTALATLPFNIRFRVPLPQITKKTLKI